MKFIGLKTFKKFNQIKLVEKKMLLITLHKIQEKKD